MRITIPTLAALLVIGMPAAAQQPDIYAAPTNLKVLPASIGPDELRETMKSFSLGTGLRCTHCHVGEEGQPLSSYDFASDEKPSKQTARVMLKMMQQINEVTLSSIPAEQREGVAVRCVTCHRGQDRPRLIQDVLAATAAEQGIDEALVRYAELRQREFGSHTFDFSPMALNQYAEQLAGAGEFEQARKVLAMNSDYYPEDFVTWFYHFRVAMMADDTGAAIQALEKAQSINPDNAFVKQQLEKLKSESE